MLWESGNAQGKQFHHLGIGHMYHQSSGTKQENPQRPDRKQEEESMRQQTLRMNHHRISQEESLDYQQERR